VENHCSESPPKEYDSVTLKLKVPLRGFLPSPVLSHAAAVCPLLSTEGCDHRDVAKLPLYVTARPSSIHVNTRISMTSPISASQKIESYFHSLCEFNLSLT